MIRFLEWLGSLLLPVKVSQTVDQDIDAIQKAVPLLLADEPALIKTYNDFMVALPKLVAAFKILWPAINATMVMVKHYTDQGMPHQRAVEHVTRKVTLAKSIPSDVLANWMNRQNATH